MDSKSKTCFGFQDKADGLGRVSCTKFLKSVGAMDLDSSVTDAQFSRNHLVRATLCNRRYDLPFSMSKPFQAHLREQRALPLRSDGFSLSYDGLDFFPHASLFRWQSQEVDCSSFEGPHDIVSRGIFGESDDGSPLACDGEFCIDLLDK